jgi:hypothetical protein
MAEFSKERVDRRRQRTQAVGEVGQMGKLLERQGIADLGVPAPCHGHESVAE